MKAASPQLDPALYEREVGSFVIDSREVRAGDVFFALSQPEYRENGFNGDFEDATAFVPGAFESGALACVVRPDRLNERSAELDRFRDRLLLADDAIRALQDLAHAVYLSWNRPVVGITGSAGKTTAKELTAGVLEASGRKILRNIKNYNNGLGHPLTVLNLDRDPSFEAAVLEMGMSTPLNEIERLCRITPPDVSVVLNVLPVHIEHLGTIENIAKAKAEIVEGMKPGGIAVLNGDDERVAAMKALSRASAITFGIDSNADVRAENITFPRFGETRFDLALPTGTVPVRFPLNGRHNIMNGLAAAAVGHSFGMPAEAVKSGLERAVPPPQRGEVLHFSEGFTVINDSYNSNPAALLSMVRTAVEGCGPAKRKVVVAGEMLELGENAAEVHRGTGREIAGTGIDRLIAVRGLGCELAEGAREGGLTDVEFSTDSNEAGELLIRDIRPGDLVLVKGSRGVRTEKVIEKLLERFDLEKG